MKTLPMKFKFALFAMVALAGAVLIRMAMAIPMFAPSAQPIGYVAQDEMTNFNLRSNREFLFRSQYEREFWSGGLLAYPADDAGNVDTVARLWDAGESMDLQHFSTARFIATMKDDGVAVGFTLGNLSAAQQTTLNNNAAMVNFLRGDRTGEGSVFRQRKHVLGDIVHSRPFYVGDKDNPTVFVGANDGMLHAINASTPGLGDGNGGKARWSYVPSMLVSKMANLSVPSTDPATPFAHDYYVDGQINIATILSGTKRVLVGGLGSGGKGLFALNITDSAGLAAASDSDVAGKVMWELSPTTLNYRSPATANAYVNLGYTYSTITMAKVPLGTGSVDAIIVGNGYNDGTGNYGACTHATPNYANCGGNYAAYLYLINANTGELIRSIKAGANGTAATPNGLSTPAAIDSDNNGVVDTVYAGDLNGTMWKFDLTKTDAQTPATKLLDTSVALPSSPALPITTTPGVAVHPSGGYMITFGTGRMLTPGDLTSTTAYYVFGVRDNAAAAALPDTALLSQTLTNRTFTAGTSTLNVRRVTSNQPNWATQKGWKVALPAGERVVGDGSFIENGRFYFTSYNPTTKSTVAGSTVSGENWLMELDYLTGGTNAAIPFLDLSGDVKLSDADRITYIATDSEAVADPTKVGKPITTTDGISVGKFISTGVLSQPILVQLVSLNDTLFNQNPDVLPPPSDPHAGVDNGHFDVDIFYGTTTAVGARATSTITVGVNGQTAGFPAKMGAIKMDGVVVVPPLDVADIPDGGVNRNTNAGTIVSKVTGGFSMTRSNNVITVTAPVGAQYNGRSFTIDDGDTAPLVNYVAKVDGRTEVPAVAPSNGTYSITASVRNSTASVVCGSTVTASGATSNSNQISSRLDTVFDNFSGKTVNGYTTTCTKAPNSGSTTQLNCTVSAPVGVSACSGGFTSTNVTLNPNNGPQGGVNYVSPITAVAEVPKSGNTNFKLALTTTAFSGGSDGAVAGDSCTGVVGNACQYKVHIHQYDDKYNRTGVNFLNASNSSINLANMIPSVSTQFKILVQNQYLNPAVKMHVGKPSYLFDVDVGYESVKTYGTQTTLTVGSLPTYVRATTATSPVLPIGSLAINMPTDALTPKNWWGNPLDVRVGLMPTTYSCVWASAGARDGNMYQPVVPPANGVGGPGTQGWIVPPRDQTDPPTIPTTPATAKGARHNGALTIQLIKATTPDSAIEQNVPGRPEYGWRVKSDQFSTYVLGEYSVYWHHPNELCYSDTGWTSSPAKDTGATPESARAAGSTDPKIGDLGVGAGGITNVVTTMVGNVTTTTLTYSGGAVATIVRTSNTKDSVTTVTIVTTDVHGNKTEETIADSAGKVKSGGDESGIQAVTGRISWRELVAP